MRRYCAAVVLAVASAILIVGCGSSPSSPTPGSGSNGGNGGSGGTGGSGGVVTNTPPQIKSITAASTRVEVGSPVTITAVVEDAETPIANLTYEWTFPGGGITGATPATTIAWTPSADMKTPADYVLTLTVTERYTSGSIQVENKVTGNVTVHVNNSPKELAELSLRFLGDFVNSKVSPEQCVSEFTSNCGSGKKEEFDDITDNRHDYEFVSSSLRHTSLSIAGDKNSATVHTFCSFTSKVISSSPRDEICEGGKKCPLGSTTTATGDCWTTNRYEQGRWWLCESHFTSATLAPQLGVIPSFFRHPGRDR
jgi:hypothetical protein